MIHPSFSKTAVRGLIAAVVLAAVTAPAGAAVLWSQMDYLTIDHGPNSTALHAPLEAYTWFDDFLVGGAPWSITHVRFSGWPYFAPRDDDVYRVEIWSNDASLGSSEPGAALFGVTVPPSAYSMTPIDTSGWAAPGDKFEIAVDLDEAFEAQADTRYWLSVYSMDNEFYWQMVVDGAVPAYDSANRRPVNDFNAQASSNVAFALEGSVVPVPAALWLMVSAVGLAAPLTRRRGA